MEDLQLKKTFVKEFIADVNKSLPPNQKYPVNDQVVFEALLGLYDGDQDFVAGILTMAIQRAGPRKRFHETVPNRELRGQVIGRVVELICGITVEPSAARSALSLDKQPRTSGATLLLGRATPKPRVEQNFSWRARANCASGSVDPEAFYRSDGTEAKKICEQCPVKEFCLQEAIAADDPWGVWGGMTAIERSRLKNKRL